MERISLSLAASFIFMDMDYFSSSMIFFCRAYIYLVFSSSILLNSICLEEMLLLGSIYFFVFIRPNSFELVVFLVVCLSSRSGSYLNFK